MSVLQSKDVDLVIDKNRKIDLYDEQIYDNKQKASQNETKIGNILGRLQTVETFINSFENRVTIIEKGSSGTGVSNTDFARLKSDVNNNISPQVTINKNDIADVKNRTSRLENNYTAMDSTVSELDTQVQNLQTKVNSNSQTDISSLKNSITSLTNSLNTTNTNVSNLETKIDLIRLNSGADNDDLKNSINNVKTDVQANITKISSLETTSNAHTNSINSCRSSINSNTESIKTINSQLTTFSDSVNSAAEGAKNANNAITSLKDNEIKNHTNQIAEIKGDMAKVRNALTPKVTQVTVSANNSQTITMEDVDFFTKQITMYCLDSEVGSRTNGKWLNTEGVATLAIESETKLVIYNDYDTALTFKIIIL